MFTWISNQETHGRGFHLPKKYTEDILKKCDMVKAKPSKTPMRANGHLELDIEGKAIYQKVCHFLIVSFIYFCASRPDVMLSVCRCAIQATRKLSHYMVIKKILRYFLHTPNLELWYPKDAIFEPIFRFKLVQRQGELLPLPNGTCR